ncbi:hypothetical protein DVDV_0940 [Desulfovibrio sp. DV]|nr:hypothetical protein DVDV_0940 [Desulfovibrio sp. DV]
MLGVTLAIGLAAEATLRLFVKSAPTYLTYEFYSNLPGDLQPNADVVDNLIAGLPYHVSTDAAGFRGKCGPRPTAAGKRVVRILCLGDSFTYGIGVPNEETYPNLLRTMLEERFPDIAFDVINAGIPFFDIVDALDYWEEKGRNLKPDLVICQFYNNDIQTMNGSSFRRTRRLPARQYHPLATFLANTRISQLTAAVAYKLDAGRFRAGDTGRPVDPWYAGRYCPDQDERQAAILGDTGKLLDAANNEALACRWAAYYRNLLELKNSVAKTQAQFVFINIPDRAQLSRNLTGPSTYLNSRLAADGIRAIDYLPLFRELFNRHDTELYNHPYDFHTNKTGNAVIAHELAAILTPGQTAGGLSLADHPNPGYPALREIRLAYDGTTLVPQNADNVLAVETSRQGIRFQGQDTDRDHVEATSDNAVAGELEIRILFAKPCTDFGLGLNPVIWTDGPNGGVSGYAAFDGQQETAIISRTRPVARSDRFLFEHHSPDAPFSQVTLRFRIAKETGLVFDKASAQNGHFTILSNAAASPDHAPPPLAHQPQPAY